MSFHQRNELANRVDRVSWRINELSQDSLRYESEQQRAQSKLNHLRAKTPSRNPYEREKLRVEITQTENRVRTAYTKLRNTYDARKRKYDEKKQLQARLDAMREWR